MKKKLIIVLCFMLMFSLTGCNTNAVDYIKEHTGLNITYLYSNVEVDDTYYSSGNKIYKYDIQKSELENVHKFIKENWTGLRNDVLYLPKNLNSPIYKQLDKDKDYCSSITFFWTSKDANGAKSEELQVWVVDKETEMYLVFSAIP